MLKFTLPKTIIALLLFIGVYYPSGAQPVPCIRPVSAVWLGSEPSNCTNCGDISFIEAAYDDDRNTATDMSRDSRDTTPVLELRFPYPSHEGDQLFYKFIGQDRMLLGCFSDGRTFIKDFLPLSEEGFLTLPAGVQRIQFRFLRENETSNGCGLYYVYMNRSTSPLFKKACLGSMISLPEEKGDGILYTNWYVHPTNHDLVDTMFFKRPMEHVLDTVFYGEIKDSLTECIADRRVEYRVFVRPSVSLITEERVDSIPIFRDQLGFANGVSLFDNARPLFFAKTSDTGYTMIVSKLHPSFNFFRGLKILDIDSNLKIRRTDTILLNIPSQANTISKISGVVQGADRQFFLNGIPNEGGADVELLRIGKTDPGYGADEYFDLHYILYDTLFNATRDSVLDPLGLITSFRKPKSLILRPDGKMMEACHNQRVTINGKGNVEQIRLFPFSIDLILNDASDANTMLLLGIDKLPQHDINELNIAKLRNDTVLFIKKTPCKDSLISNGYPYIVWEGGIPTPDGGYLIAGTLYYGPDSRKSDFIVIKLDDSANVAWERTYGGSGADELRGFIRSDKGTYLLAGNSFSTDGDISSDVSDRTPFLILDIDQHGNVIEDYKLRRIAFAEGPTRLCAITKGLKPNSYLITAHSGTVNADILLYELKLVAASCD